MGILSWEWPSLVERVRSKCLVDPATGCWLWQGGKDKNGYPKLFIEGRHWRGNRAMLYAMTGRLDEMARHRCDTPPCMNPDHLVWGSALDNKADAVERGRAVSNFVPLAGEKNGRSKLTDQQRQEIRERRLAGERVAALAAEFNVDRGTIHRCCPGLKPGPGQPLRK